MPPSYTIRYESDPTADEIQAGPRRPHNRERRTVIRPALNAAARR